MKNKKMQSVVISQALFSHNECNSIEKEIPTTPRTKFAITQRLFSVMGIIFVLCAAVFGQNGHLHQLEYNNASWVDSDLTTLTGGPLPQPQGVAAFYTTPNDQLHVYYVSQQLELHESFFDGTSWSDANLTALTGGYGPSAQSAVSGFSIGNVQYVYFCGTDSTIHEYAYGNNNNWNWVDTVLPGGGSSGHCHAATNDFFYPVGLVAFVTTPNNQRHVYYQGTSSTNQSSLWTVRQLYFNGSKWSNQSLTAMAHGVKAQGGSWMSGFANGNYQYVFYTAANGHIHQSSYVNNWTDTDVTKAAGGVAAWSNGAAAFLVPGTTQAEVYYSAKSNNDIHQMTFQNNQWSDADLTAAAGGTGPIYYSQVVGFATTPNNQLHVYYGASNEMPSFVTQLYLNGSYWQDQALPSAEINGLFSGMAGFSIGNLQYVYYVSAN